MNKSGGNSAHQFSYSENIYERAVIDCAQTLLSTPENEDAVYKSLETLRASTGVTRVYLFKNYNVESGVIYSGIFKEAYDLNSGNPPFIETPLLQHFSSDDFPAEYKRFIKGKPVDTSSDNPSPELKAVMQKLNKKATLYIPIFAGKKFWGFIGFSEEQTTRMWSQDDKYLLDTTAKLFGSYFEKLDNTEKLHHSYTRYKNLFQNVHDAIIIAEVTDGKFDIIDCNPKAIALFDCKTKKDLLEGGILQYSPEFQPDNSSSRDSLEKIVRNLDRKSNILFEWQCQTRSGKLVDCHINLSQYYLDDKLYYLAVVRDISSLKSAELKLQERVKEMRGIANISQQAQQEVSIERFCEYVITHLPHSMVYPEKAEIAIELDGSRFGEFSLYEKPGYHNLHSEIVCSGNHVGGIAIFYPEGHEFMLPEEQVLADNIAKIIGMYYERFNVERELRDREKYVSALAENIPGLVSHVDKNLRYQFASRGYERLFGKHPDEMIGKPVTEVIGETLFNEVKPNVDKVLSGEQVKFESKITLPDGESNYVFTIFTPDIGPEGEVSGFYILAIDITDRIKAENALKDSEDRFRSFFENSMDAILVTIPDGRILSANPAACEMFECSMESLINRGRDGLVDTSDPNLKYLLSKRKDDGRAQGELTFIKCDGTRFPGEVTSALFSDSKGQTKSSMIIRDITDRKKAQDELKQTINEKNVLLQEIHHRVKNNLAIISSMMYMQAATTQEKGVQEALTTTQNRIKSIALVHEKLYQNELFSAIPFDEYIRKLSENLSESIKLPDHNINLEYDTQPVKLNLNQIIPAGLLLNEILTNAFKHAFAGRTDGTISISLKNNNNIIQLQVADNGIGMPDEATRDQSGLGTRIIENLADQLNGTLFTHSDHGTCVSVEFPLRK